MDNPPSNGITIDITPDIAKTLNQSNVYAKRLFIYTSVHSLIRLCVSQFPKGFILGGKPNNIHNTYGLFPNSDDTSQQAIFFQVLSAELNKLHNKLENISYLRKLELWWQHFGLTYPMNYSFSIILVIDISPKTPYEIQQTNRFWLEKYTQYYITQQNLYKGEYLSPFPMLWRTFVENYKGDPTDLRAQVTNQLLEQIRREHQSDLAFKQFIDQDKQLFSYELWNKQQLIQMVRAQQAIQFMDLLTLPEHELLSKSEQVNSVLHVTKSINEIKTLKEKIKYFALSYNILKYKNCLYAEGDPNYNSVPFYLIPDHPPKEPEALEIFLFYESLVKEGLRILKNYVQACDISVEEKLQHWHSLFGHYDAVVFNLSTGQLKLEYKPTSRKDIEAYNTFLIQAYQTTVYNSISAEQHQQLSFEERCDAVKHIKDRQEVDRLIQKFWQTLPEPYLLKELVIYLQRGKKIDFGKHCWDYCLTARYIVARDAYNYLLFLKKEIPKSNIFNSFISRFQAKPKSKI